MQRLYGEGIGDDGIINDDDSMCVIRHNDEFSNGYIGEMLGDFIPALKGNDSDIIQLHFSIDTGSEKVLPVVGADGYEIGTRIAVIISLEACRINAVFVFEFLSHRGLDFMIRIYFIESF
jgi:hypothetical protein